MARYLLNRSLQGLISILGASLIIFIISRLSGDPVVLMVPVDAPPAVVDAMRAHLGLDRPLLVQYFVFLQNALAGDFGNSYRWQVPALQLILDRLPATIELAAAALGFSVMIAVPFGVMSAVHRGSWIDSFGRGSQCSARPCPASGWGCC